MQAAWFREAFSDRGSREAKKITAQVSHR